MRKLISYFFDDYKFNTQSFWFKRLLYTFVIIKCVYWLCFYNILFGENSIVFSQPKSINFVKDLAFYLYNSCSTNLGYKFITGAIALCILPFIIKKLYFISDFILWLLIINISNKIYPTLTGGDYLLHQFLFFNCFLYHAVRCRSAINNNIKYIKTVLHNFASIAIIIQICLVYFLSAAAKLSSPQWMYGSAVATIMQIQHYSIYPLSSIKPNFFTTLLNYTVLFYQLLFTLLIWFKKLKTPLLIIGILMHLYIAFIMGLMSFGCIMILGYVYFWDFKAKEKSLLN